MKPATPRHPKHDSACPFCGEPFRCERFLGHRLGWYRCARCSGHFSIVGETYYDQAANRLPSWVGDPLPATGGAA